MRSVSKGLIDRHGRKIRKLRVSLLDACNYRCVYCMPLNPVFMNASNWLSPEELEYVCSGLVDFGIEQIRLTGGEPTLRKEFKDIVRRLSSLPLTKLGLTTNGWNLGSHLDFLSDTNCKYINVSVDSLSPETFKKITVKGDLNYVLRSVVAARKRGFYVKINAVIMRGINDCELMDFVRFSAENEIEVRFLELMSIGQVKGKADKLFVSASEMIEEISRHEQLIPETTECDSTSFNYKTSSGARIGFIASETFPFCSSCSRWRLSADGFLRACLMSEKGLNIRGIDKKDYPFKLRELLDMKPYTRMTHLNQHMYKVGG